MPKPMPGQGAVAHLSLCGSGAPVDIPLRRDGAPLGHDGGACVLACHADVARRRGAGAEPGGRA